MSKYQAHLIQPSEKYKQRKYADSLKRPKDIETTEVEEIKLRLSQSRENCIVKIDESIENLKRRLDTLDGVSAHWVNDSEQAVNIIKKIAGNTRILNINKSGTVKEIEPELTKVGFEIKNSYLVDYDSDIKGKFEFFWQQPEFHYRSIENWFDNTERITLANSKSTICYDMISLIGVNAISAETGNPYFLQHTSNITQLLKANRVILLVALEKIVPTDTDASFQTKWAGIFGLEKVLLDLTVPPEKDKSTFNALENITDKHNTELQQKVDIVLLDNGRKKLLDTPFRDLMRCISCRSCRKRCPNYPYFGKYRGYYPQLYAFSYLMGENPSIDLCAQCGNCSPECPVGIDVAWMIAQAKALKGRSIKNLRDLILGRPDLLGKMSCMGAPLSIWATKQPAIRFAMEKIVGIPKKRILPTADKPWKKKGKVKKQNKTPIIYFMGCNAKYFEPQIADSAVKLLEENGFKVITPDFKCCGRPTVSSGGIKELRAAGEYNIKNLMEFEGKRVDIVTTCPTCSYALKHDYTKLGVGGTQGLADRVYDIGNYLWLLNKEGKLKTKFSSCPKKYSYHKPCHLHIEQLNYETVALLNSLVPQIKVESINKGCCGMMGSFGQKIKNYDYSMTTGGPIFKTALETGANEILTECNLCRLQLIEGTGKNTIHPVELLAGLMRIDK